MVVPMEAFFVNYLVIISVARTFIIPKDNGTDIESGAYRFSIASFGAAECTFSRATCRILSF